MKLIISTQDAIEIHAETMMDEAFLTQFVRGWEDYGLRQVRGGEEREPFAGIQIKQDAEPQFRNIAPEKDFDSIKAVRFYKKPI